MNQITTNDDPLKSFKEKLTSRLRDDIRDLLPEEVLQELVKKAIQDEFFTPTRVRAKDYNSFNQNYEDGPSEFTKQVLEYAKPLIEEKVKEIVGTYEYLIEDTVKEYVSEKNLDSILTLTVVGIVGKEMANSIASNMSNIYELQQKLNINVY